jgi:hypothetical protein
VTRELRSKAGHADFERVAIDGRGFGDRANAHGRGEGR